MFRRLWYFFRREQAANDLNDEMRFHQEQRAKRLEQSGRSPGDAASLAHRHFGNLGALAQESRSHWGFGGMDRLAQDLRFAFRRVRQRPGFSLPIVLIMGLGIGTTTAMFSAMDAAMLRSLPFHDPGRLVMLTRATVPFEPEMAERNEPGARELDLLDAASLHDAFSSVAAFAAGGLNLSEADRPLRLNVGVVTASFFSTLGVSPVIGRDFSIEEGQPNGPSAVLLSHALWKGQFGGGDVLGRTLRLNEKAYTVVGVMPAGFGFPNRSDVWIPMPVPTTFATFEPFRGFLPSRVFARLAPGATLGSAAAGARVAWDRVLAGASPGQDWASEARDEIRSRGALTPLQDELVGPRRRALLILFGATLLLLLIACANVANLLLSDASIRRREIAVREVLGAGRGRIVRQLLVESLVMALGGAGLGLLLAPGLLGVLGALMPEDLAGTVAVTVNPRVLGFTTLVAVLTGLGFGLWPALSTTRLDVAKAIKSAGGHGATGHGLGGVRRGLVAAEIALTTMLLIGAGLLLRSFVRLMAEPTGLASDGIATMEVSFGRAQSRADRLRIIDGVLERLEHEPGVTTAAAVNDLPLRTGGKLSITFELDGVPAPTKDRTMARYLIASPDYFGTLGIPLLAGRSFRPSDDSLAPPVVIISEAMARKYWPGVNPVGRAIRTPHPDSMWFTVIGVVGDVREMSLDRKPDPQMYYSINAQTPASVGFVIRGTLPPSGLMRRLTRALRDVAPAQPGYNLRMLDEVIGESVRPRRTNVTLLTLFAACALVLASLGVYGVVRYSASQRNREFGIRVALGARGNTLIGLLVTELSSPVVLGLVAGLAGAWGLSRVLTALLYGIEPRDAGTFLAAPFALLIPAAIAALVPALRASRLDPTEVLRAE